MIVAEHEGYEGVLDWVKEKLGIGYVKLKDYTDLNLMREHSAILKGLGIRHYSKCSGTICSLYVQKEHANKALQAIEAVTKPTIRKTESPLKYAKLLTNIPLIVGIAMIPLLAVIVTRLRK